MQSFKLLVLSGVFAVAALTPGWLVAQEVAITGKDFESGAADAKLAEIARQAAASGKTVVVTAPPYWQGKAASKLHAGAGNVQVKTTDAFFENVLVRIVDAPADKVAEKPKAEAKPAVAAKPEAKPVAAPVAAPAPKVAAKPAAPKAEPAAAAAPAVATAAPAPAPEPVAPFAPVPPPAPAAAPVAVAAPPPAAAPAPAAVAPPASASSPAAAQANLADARKKFEAKMGKAAEGSVKPGQLQKGDEIFVSGPARAVVRRFGSHVQMFWLEGDLNLERTEIAMTEAGHYKVLEQVNEVASTSVRQMHTTPQIFTAEIPAKSQVRTDMEKHFNEAKEITGSLTADQLRYGDLFYVYRTYAVIFRRTDLSFERFWLNGQIDLNQAGIVKDGDAYRMVSDHL